MQTIARLAQQINDDTDMLFVAVADSRECADPLTWEEIGLLVGTSRQSAWARFTLANLVTASPQVHPGQEELF